MTDPNQFRRQLTRWTTGITVITTMGSGGPLGKAANSFHSVSLDPPLVGWCVDIGSSRYAEWLAAPGYVVHVLAEDQLDLVGRFATRGGNKFADLSYERGPLGLPRIDDALLRITCRMGQQHPAGDHTYLIGEVLEVEERADAEPLLFHNGKPRTGADLARAYTTR